MKPVRIAGYIVGVALFYGTLTGVCQTIPAPPETRPAHETVVTHTSIEFLATGTKPGDPTPQSCRQVLAVLLPAIQAYPHPDGWTWFVACDEPAWARIQKHQGNQVGSGILAITNRAAHSTIIRGSSMLHPFSEDYRAQPEHIVAHELCHIYLQSSDEYEVDSLATKWVEKRRAQRLVIIKP